MLAKKSLLSRFNFRKWTFDGMALANPITIIWRLVMVIPYILTLSLFCAVYFISRLDFGDAVDVWKSHSVGW